MAFPDTLDSDFGTLVDSTDYPQAAHVNTLRRAVEGLEKKMGIDGSTAVYSIDYKVNKFFVPATKLYFYAASPPTGWSSAGLSDRVLAISGGSTYTTGGSQQGTWTMPDHTHSTSITATGWSYVGAHTIIQGRIIAGSLNTSIGGISYTNTRAFTSGNPSSVTTWRPYAAVGIIAYNGNFLEYYDS